MEAFQKQNSLKSTFLLALAKVIACYILLSARRSFVDTKSYSVLVNWANKWDIKLASCFDLEDEGKIPMIHVCVLTYSRVNRFETSSQG